MASQLIAGVLWTMEAIAWRGLRSSCPVFGGHTRRATVARVTILQIKVAHTAIFAVLSCCVVYTLYSAVFNQITGWTWVAVILVLLESIVLISAGWKCPLTTLAESLGASDGAVVDIFLPKWFADRIFPVCGTTFFIASALLVLRLLQS